jgi:tape measure domain-containing protein
MDLSSLNVIFGADDNALARGIQSAITQLGSYARAAQDVANQAGNKLDEFADRAGAAGRKAANDLAAGFSSANGQLKASFDALDAQQKKLEEGYGRLGNAIKSAGAGLTTYVTLPLLAGGAAAVKTYADFEKLQLGLQTLSKQDLALQGITGLEAAAKSAELAKTRFAELTEVAKAPGIGLEQAVKGDIRLRSVGISADLAKRSLVEFANAVAKSGGDAVQLDGLTVQLGQLGASAKLTAADLKPILNAAPSVAVQLQKLYGTVSASEIQKQLAAQGQSTKDFIGTLVTELAKSERATGGLGNSFDNLGNSIQGSLATIGASIAKNLNLQSVVDKIAGGIESVGTAFSNLSPTAQKVILSFAGVAAAAGPILVAVGAIVAAIPAVTAGFSALGVTSVAALAPLLPIAGAVAAAALLIYNNWDELVAYFKGPGAQAINTVSESFSGVIKAVQNASAAYDELATTVKSALGIVDTASEKSKAATDSTLTGLISATGIFKALFEELTTGISAIADTFSNTINFISDLLQGNFSQALRDAGANVESLSRPIRNLLFKQEQSDSFSNFFREVIAGSKQTQQAVEELDASLSGALLGGGNLEGTIESIDTLNARLKEAKDRRDALQVGTKAFYDAKADVASLEALIKKYLDTGKAAKKAADELLKAFQDAQNKVAGINFRVNVGVESQFDGAFEKVKVLTTAVEKLSSLPGGSGSPYMVKLLAQLDSAKDGVTKLLASLRFKPSDAPIEFDIDGDTIAQIKKELDDANLKAKVQFEYDRDASKLAAALSANQEAAIKQLADNKIPVNTNETSKSIAGAAPTLAKNAFDTSSLKAYTQAMQELNNTQGAFGAGFNAAAEKMQVTATRLRDLIALGKQGTPEFQQLTAELKQLKMAADWSDITNSATDALKGLLIDIATTVADNLADIALGNASAQDGFAQLFSGVLASIGGFLQQLGAQLVTYGLLNLAFTTLASNPLTAPAAIAVGLAAIAAGAVFKAISKKVAPSAGASSGSSGGASTGAGSGSSYNATNNSKLQVEIKLAPVEFRAEGSQLRAVTQIDTYRLRTTR